MAVGFPAKAHIYLDSDASLLAKVAKAICKHENGVIPYTDAEFLAAALDAMKVSK